MKTIQTIIGSFKTVLGRKTKNTHRLICSKSGKLAKKALLITTVTKSNLFI
jgi:hypothetical protein